MFRTFLLFYAFSLCLFPAFAAEIRLKHEPVSCTQTLLTLGDVAAVIGDTAEAEQLRQTVLCVAPQDGETRTFTQNGLRSLLSQLGIPSAKHRITGAEQITLTSAGDVKNSFVQELPRRNSKPSTIVAANYSSEKEPDDSRRFVVPATVRAANPLRKDNLPPQMMTTLETQVAEAVNVFLRSNNTANSTAETTYKITVHLTQEQARLLATSGQIEDITESSAGKIGGQRVFTLQMQKHTEAGTPVCVNVEADVALLQQAVILKRSLPKGSLISESDVMLKTVDRAKNEKGEVFTDISALTGQETTGSLREGSVITTGMVKKPTWVHKGDIVTVRVQNNGIFVRTEGTALQDGTDGDTVSIETIPYKNPNVRGRQVKQEPATFLARVCAPKTVEVFASPVSAGN